MPLNFFTDNTLKNWMKINAISLQQDSINVATQADVAQLQQEINDISSQGDPAMNEAINVPSVGTFESPPIQINSDGNFIVKDGNTVLLQSPDNSQSIAMFIENDGKTQFENSTEYIFDNNVRVKGASLQVSSPGDSQEFSASVTVDNVAKFEGCAQYTFDGDIFLEKVFQSASLYLDDSGNLHVTSTQDMNFTSNGNDINIVGNLNCKQGVVQTFQSADEVTSFTIQDANGGAASFSGASNYNFDNNVNIVNGSDTSTLSTDNTGTLNINAANDINITASGNDVNIIGNATISAPFSLNCNTGAGQTFQSADALTYFTVHCANSSIASFENASLYRFDNQVSMNGPLSISNGGVDAFTMTVSGDSNLHIAGADNVNFDNVGNVNVANNLSCTILNVNSTLFINGAPLIIKSPDNQIEFNITVGDDNVAVFNGVGSISFDEPIYSNSKLVQPVESGNTASRPVVVTIGYMYFDTQLIPPIPIWWDGAQFVNSAGAPV